MKQKKKIKQVQQKHQKQSALHLFKPNIWLALISAIVGFCLYANTLTHEYVLDDGAVITNNPSVMKGISGIPEILSVDMWHFENVNLGYYRPLSMITFAIENQFFPKNPHVSHLENVILYAMTGFFLCLLLMNLFRNFHPVFSFIITLLFIAHPIHTEAVSNIKSRDEILAFLNLIIAIFMLLRAYKPLNINYKLVFLSCIFFYFALLSKETAMTGILLAPLMLFFSNNLSIKQSLLRATPFLVMVLIFQLQKYAMIGTVSGVIVKDIVNYPYSEAGAELSSAFLILLHGVRLIIFPHPLSYDYSYNQIPAQNFDSPQVIAGVFVAASLAYFGLKGFLKKSILSFSILIFCVTLAPALAFVFFKGGILAERFLYAPSLGFCIVMVWLAPLLSLRRGEDRATLHNFWLQKFSKLPSLWEGLGVGCLFIVFCFYSFKTVTRSPAWHDNMTLFSTDINASPNSCQIKRHYGSELINLGISETDPQKKIEWFNKGAEQLREALRINPHFGDAFFKMGVAYQTLKVNNDSAIFYYTHAIREMPGNAMSYNNLGILYESAGKQELASYCYNKVVEVNPYFPNGARNRDAHKKKYGEMTTKQSGK